MDVASTPRPSMTAAVSQSHAVPHGWQPEALHALTEQPTNMLPASEPIQIAQFVVRKRTDQHIKSTCRRVAQITGISPFGCTN